jgi:hypothetical protein
LTEKLRSAASSAARAARSLGRYYMVGGLAALTLLSTGKTAQAQFVEPSARKPFAIRLGTYIPSARDGRAAGGDYMWAIEGDYTIQRLPERSSVSVLSVGYIERNDLRIVPLTIGQIWREPRNPDYPGKSYFYGLGLGLYNIRVSQPDTSSETKYIFGGYVTAGIDFTDKFFGEVKYHYMARIDRKFVGGLMFAVGTRF